MMLSNRVFTLLELEYAIRREIKARVSLCLEYGIPLYMIKSISFLFTTQYLALILEAILNEQATG